MRRQDAEILKIFEFELKFLEDGGYRRSRVPWRASLIFEDSPTCINFNDRSRSHPCSECPLIEFVPPQYRNESAPCRLITVAAGGQTVDDFYRYGTTVELEKALACWLRKRIQTIENRPSGEAKKVAS